MWTVRIVSTIGLILIGAGCAEEPTLRERLIGTWDLADINGHQIPGSIQSCYTQMSPGGIPSSVCDSIYLAARQLTLQPDNRCEQITVYATTTLTQSCTYVVNDNSASIEYDGGGRFDLDARSDDLWVSAAPCTYLDLDCANYTEHYLRRKS